MKSNTLNRWILVGLFVDILLGAFWVYAYKWLASGYPTPNVGAPYVFAHILVSVGYLGLLVIMFSFPDRKILFWISTSIYIISTIIAAITVSF